MQPAPKFFLGPVVPVLPRCNSHSASRYAFTAYRSRESGVNGQQKSDSGSIRIRLLDV